MRLINQVSQLCKELGFAEAYRFARSLEATPNDEFPGLAAVGNPDAQLVVMHDYACSKSAALIKARHNMPGSETEHVTLFSWAVLIAQNFHPIPLLPGAVLRQHAKRSDQRNIALQDAEISAAIDDWIAKVSQGNPVMSASVMLHLANRPDLRARLRKAGIEDDVFDAISETFAHSRPLSAQRVIGWCKTIKELLLRTGPHGQHGGLTILADTTRRAFLRFKLRMGGPDSGVAAKGFRTGSYMGWSFDLACFVYPSLADHEGVATWRSVNRRVEANPDEAEQLLAASGLKGVRCECLPWLP